MKGSTFHLMAKIIAFIEICFSLYIIGICGYGLSNAHFDWITRRVSEFDTAILKISGAGIAVAIIEIYFSSGLFLVGFCHGDPPNVLGLNLVLAHIFKNVCFFIMSFGLIVYEFTRWRKSEVDNASFAMNFVMFMILGVTAPLLTTMFDWKYHSYIKQRNIQIETIIGAMDKIERKKPNVGNKWKNLEAKRGKKNGAMGKKVRKED